MTGYHSTARSLYKMNRTTQDRIMVCIPIHNRHHIAELCIPTVRGSMTPDDYLALYDDGSETSAIHLLDTNMVNASFHQVANPMGVDAQRRTHILDFWQRPEFTHLYFSDSDAFVDPEWRSRLLEIHNRTGMLTCGYHTKTHEDYAGNVFDRRDGIVFTRFAPGVSYLLSRAQVEKIVASLPKGGWSFDWFIPSILGYKCAVSDESVVDHIGSGGQHDPADGSIGPERALNPTPALAALRAEIIAKLNAR